MLINFKITDITCEACVKLSTAALKGLPGVTRVVIDENGLTLVESDHKLDWETIKKALAEVGKNASLI